MTDRELMQQALDFISSVMVHPSQIAARDAIADALEKKLAQPERIQLTVRDFVVTVGGLEDAVGTPTYWAEWPNKEQP